MKERLIDGNSSLDIQKDQLVAIERNEHAQLVEYTKEEDGADKKLNRAKFDEAQEETEESGLHLVVVPPGHSPAAVLRAQHSQGNEPIFDSPSTVYVNGQETQV